MTKLGYLTIVIIMLFNSCAIIGTTFKQYDKSEQIKIKSIALVIEDNIYNNEKIGKYVDSLFINHIDTEVVNIFKCEVVYFGKTGEPLESVKNYISKYGNFDAIFECSIDPYIMSTFTKPYRYNSTVRTILLKIPENKIIAKTKFSTNLGKTYWRHPILEVAIRDGVIGAIRPYSRLFK